MSRLSPNQSPLTTHNKYALIIALLMGSALAMPSGATQSPATKPPVAQASVAQSLTPAPSHPMPSPTAMALSDTSEFNQAFNDFLLSDAYSHKTTEGYWKRKAEPEPAKEPDLEWLKWLEPILKWIDSLNGIVEGLSLLLKILLVLFLLAVIWWLYRRREVFVALAQKFTGSKTTITQKLHTYRPTEHLPDNAKLIALIDTLIKQGDYLKALSLLYRGSLRQLRLVHELPITDSQTEAQCQALLAKARHRTQAEVAFFDELVRLWQLSAYGRRVPSEPSTITTLFLTWQSLYDLTSDNSTWYDKQKGEHD